MTNIQTIDKSKSKSALTSDYSIAPATFGKRIKQFECHNRLECQLKSLCAIDIQLYQNRVILSTFNRLFKETGTKNAADAHVSVYRLSSYDLVIFGLRSIEQTRISWRSG